ncbi:starch synthase [Sporobacter termitidis DSM 10068]|uniref:Glycogen synthase n=1 Tax=Sporobacter termitidis DSM 10068 TaxID=1123282 RepID=A0A1M5YNF1_9FIRM|nr:glycogen synthase GlgA [Sporobacter termitidis]SHI13480.1 starch synthase [Sporobacter termitidis DSM 10068]
MADQLKVLFAAFEAEPFAKTGGLGDVCGSLPGALQKAGVDARVILPKFGTIPQEYRAAMTPVADFRVRLAWRDQYCGLETLTHRGVVFYFVDNEYYFKRDRLYGYDDDGERVAFFSKAVLECLAHMPGFFPRVLHCHDWHAALVPVYLRELYGGADKYRDIKTVFTIHNLKFQGVFSRFYLGDVLGLDGYPAAADQLAQFDAINYMRGGLNYADAITTVSPAYAEEIRTDFYGERAQDILNRRRNVLTGILNGIDSSAYDPAADTALYALYTADDLSGKAENKKRLQAELGLEVRDDTPLAILVSRLTEQKGLDLVVRILDELPGENMQLAVLGVGDKKYEDAFSHFAGKYPGKVAARLAFDERLSRKFYAGGDMILIPSLFEPCGLTQMIAMRYGTLPIVRETGGLKDSVTPYNQFTGAGTGFSFKNFNAHELLDTVRRAIQVYSGDRPAWERLMKNAMAADFSWNASAEKYTALYRGLLKA